MTQILRMSNLYAPTLKEDPSDADIDSARLLLRAGMLRKAASGLYTFLPLGFRVLKKIENIVREEMDASGAQEILMPVLQPAELWEESGRLNDYGPELMRLTDRHDREMCLGPTHEEIIVALVRNELRSYKELPQNLYQIQTKYRDEIRPRFGLLRSREFVMKDAYSFNATQESLQETYDAMGKAYGAICTRCGLDYREVEADGGQIGGKVTTEFMALAESGEADLVYCSCGYAADAEAGACLARPTLYEVGAMEKIATPGVHTITELAEFLSIPESSTVKALSGKDAEGNLVCLFIPGDHELNELKIEGLVPGFTLLTDEEMISFGLCKGSMGPVGLPEGARVIAATSLQAIPQWVVGANEDGYHYVGARLGEDFQVDEWADLATVKPGDCCPECGLPLEAPAASKWPRSSSLATSTPAPWALPSWTRTARRSPSSWAATAWASRARWPPSWSSTTTSTASCGRCRWRRPTFAWCRSRWVMPRCSLWPRRSRRTWPSSASRWSSTIATSALA